MQWETSITEQCAWTTMLKIVNYWKKPMGQSVARFLLLFLEQPTWMGDKRLSPHNGLILSPCIIPICHLYLMLDQKNQSDISSLGPDPCLFQTIAGISPWTFLLVSYYQRTAEEWESEEWPRVFISSRLPTDLWSTAVLYFKALTVSDQCRNIA